MHALHMEFSALAPLPALSPAPARLLDATTLNGCNLYHDRTVIRQEVDFGALRGTYSEEAGGDFARRFVERFSQIAKTIPNARVNEPFLRRLARGRASFEEALLEAILYVETSMAFVKHDFRPIRGARVVSSDSATRAFLVWETRAPAFSRAAARVALAGIAELLPASLLSQTDDLPDFSTAFAELEARAERQRWATTSAVILLAADRRRIPSETISGPHMCFGQGEAQRVLYSSVPGDVPLASVKLCGNKWRTNRRLLQLRLPVPSHSVVGTVDDALAAAEKIGYPVVVKPLKGKQAEGVTVGIGSPEEIPPAFERAHRGELDVMIESYVPGDTYRFLVIHGRFIAALKVDPPSVTGDGVRTVGALIEALNNHPLRDGVHLFPIEVDDEVIALLGRNGFSLDSVPAKGQQVRLRSAANVAVGGVHTDVTDQVHPATKEMAIRAAEGVWLNVAGIDFVSPDITQHYEKTGAKIIEINARPGMCMHTFPHVGHTRDVAGALLDDAFPPRGNSGRGRIPTAMIFGERRTGAVARELDTILRASGKTTGLLTKKGAYLGGMPETLGKMQQRDAVRVLLGDPRVQAFVGTTSPARTVERGIMLDRVDVAAITSHTGDESADMYRKSAEVAARASNVIVIHAANKAVRELAREQSKTLILVSDGKEDLGITEHLAAGGSAVFRVHEQGQDLIAVHCKGRPVVRLGMPAEEAGQEFLERRMETRMFAIALAVGMGITGEALKAAGT